ncbi:VOC family protein [Polymorphobacter fuscus]|uniref:VOC family protein n=1 Tax=Sandarakinorhabdus fusca TaxID=1439888 RepID=A0A7C9KHP1_9SPHN|nr:VOC family protein [Polymorphobacter fuscus]KAB7648965.1 VOC family protein [Polymorphobacter fuscus]MQT16559.1 VOC family protein [Polymorphobacter fuscus]NJC07150.1 catechol 2,3-dioxygenase-like lactoylglutathione lyase family enzyme [Polymorphobacter fuscus]
MLSLATATPVTFVMTTDAERSRRFYAETLSLPLGTQDEYAMVYDLAGTILRITEVPQFAAGPHPVLGWKVADVVAIAGELRARGVTFTIYDGLDQDQDGIWTAPDGAAQVAWFNDPDGNVLSLTKS